jgi:Fe-S cluster assembly protein SufD
MTFPAGLEFPTRRDEKWKYTSLKPWLEKSYQKGGSEGPSPQVQLDFGNKLILINGTFRADLSRPPEGLSILKQTTAQLKGPVSKDGRDESLVTLNSLMSSESLVIRVAPGTVWSKPCHLLLMSSSSSVPTMNFPRIKLEVGEGARADFLVQHESENDSLESFVSSHFQAEIRSRASVEIVFLQKANLRSFHYEKSEIHVADSARLKILEVAMGGLLSRSELEVDIKGSESNVDLLGIYALSANQQSDHYTSMKHWVGGSQTVQIYKGLLDQNSKSVFNGHVWMAPGAQKAQSEQLNKNLILSSTAEANSKPELEIFADDVKATHGSTIGQIQKDEIFYLQTRGIKKEQAIRLVSEAFVMDVVHRLENPHLKSMISASLRSKGAIQ